MTLSAPQTSRRRFRPQLEHKDTDLDPLRQRDDFQKLLADLEAKEKPAPPQSQPTGKP
jgi:hypothetical protein